MFTGIIQSVGRIRARAHTPTHQGLSMEIETGFTDLELGESVAISGVCLTVAELKKGATVFYVSPETIDRTRLGALHENSQVNLERALLPNTRLSGHIVQGHVDGVARAIRIERREECYELDFELPENLARYVVEKGSIAIDGVSLTVNRIEANRLSVMLIPHTWTHTAFSSLKVNDPVNIEVDIMAKYLEKLCQPYQNQLKSR